MVGEQRICLGDRINKMYLEKQNIADKSHLIEQWANVALKLKQKHGDASFNNWMKTLDPETIEAGCVIMTVSTRFLKEWILSHYLKDLNSFWKEENNSINNIEIKVRKNNDQSYSDNSGNLEGNISNNITVLNRAANEIDNNSTFSGTRFDPRFTFDNFVVGTSNRLAQAVAKNLAEENNVTVKSNPLFIYGGVGLGKTHLMQAIGQHIQKNNIGKKILYMSAEKFMYRFVRALRDKDIVNFKEYFRSVDMLMIDDIQFICGKGSTQEEFFHTFNELVDNNKQLVITADRSPSDLKDLDKKIQSRLGGGLVIDINNADYDLRLGILKAKMEILMKKDHKLNPVPDSVLEFVARKITSNIRELEGALHKIITDSLLMKREVTIESTKIVLSDLIRANEHVLTLDDIKKNVAEYYNINIADINSARKLRKIARPRQVAMYLAKKLTKESLMEIGSKFGGKDHATVVYSNRQIEKLCESNEQLRKDVQLLINRLSSI